jgi:cytochrome P450
MQRDPIGMFMEAAALGDIVELSFPTACVHLLTRSEHIKHVLVDNHKGYGKETRGYRVLRLGLGQGLLTSEGELWRRQRRLMQPTFHHGRIASFAEIMTSCTTRMLDEWAAKRGAEVDVASEMMRLTLRIVGLCLMGTDLTDESDRVASALHELLHLVVARINNPIQWPMSIPTPKNRAFEKALRHLDDVVFGILSERRRSPGSRGDLLEMLMEARDEETNEAMSDRQLRDEVLTLVLAGHETTANAMSWTWFSLSRNPAVRTRLHEEVDRLGGPPAVGDLPALRYVQAVIEESMRLFPPAWVTARNAVADDEIGGVRIPKGSYVFVSPYVTHRLPEYFPNPEGFLPERFLDPAIEQLPKYAYFPFGGGPRICIGNAFAMMEAKLLVATIARRFDLDLVPGHPVIPKPLVTLRPQHGIRMRLVERRPDMDDGRRTNGARAENVAFSGE